MAKAEGAGGRSSDIVMLPNREKTRSLQLLLSSLPPGCRNFGTGLLCRAGSVTGSAGCAACSTAVRL